MVLLVLIIILQAMSDWGELMQRAYSKKSSLRHLDPSLTYIGYYTDLGAYYYHVTEPNKTYEETFLDIREYYMKSGIPYKWVSKLFDDFIIGYRMSFIRYLQYDDWFYPSYGSAGGGTYEWDASDDVFPHGLRYRDSLSGATNYPRVFFISDICII